MPDNTIDLAADPIRGLGLRLLEWASINPDDVVALSRFAKAIEFSTIPEAAADIAGAFTPPQPECDECGASALATFESAPGAFHDQSCSLYVPETPLGDVRVTPAAFEHLLGRVQSQEPPSR